MSPERSQERRRTITLKPHDADALALRLAGQSVRAIATTQGCAVSEAHRRVQRALTASVHEVGEDAVRVEVQRLDQLWAAVHPRAAAGDLDAIDRALKIAQRRSRLLGLDAPQRVVVTQLDPIAAEMETLAAELERRAAGGPVPVEVPRG